MRHTGMRWFVSIASAVVFAGSAAFASDAAKLVQRLKAVAKPDVGITKKEREVAEQLQALAPRLFPFSCRFWRTKTPRSGNSHPTRCEISTV